MAAQREAVHVRAGHLELLGDLGGLRGHLLARERVGEPVVGHGVERLDVAHAEPEARLGEQVGRPRHRLHAARHRELEIARAHGLIDDADGPQARGADLVDGLRGDLLGDPGLDLGLAGRDLPLAGLQHLAHDHVLDLVRLDLGALERGLDRGPPSSVASTLDRPPPSLPKGVRAALSTTVLLIGAPPRFLALDRSSTPPRGRATGCLPLAELPATLLAVPRTRNREATPWPRRPRTQATASSTPTSRR